MDVSLYRTLDKETLEKELGDVTNNLVYHIKEHAYLQADYHVEFIRAWAQSAGGNVSAKDRDAEFQNKDRMQEVINHKGMIDALTIQREYLLCLIK